MPNKCFDCQTEKTMRIEDLMRVKCWFKKDKGNVNLQKKNRKLSELEKKKSQQSNFESLSWNSAGDCQIFFVFLSEAGGAENPWFTGGGEKRSQSVQGS